MDPKLQEALVALSLYRNHNFRGFSGGRNMQIFDTVGWIWTLFRSSSNASVTMCSYRISANHKFPLANARLKISTWFAAVWLVSRTKEAEQLPKDSLSNMHVKISLCWWPEHCRRNSCETIGGQKHFVRTIWKFLFINTGEKARDSIPRGIIQIYCKTKLLSRYASD